MGRQIPKKGRSAQKTVPGSLYSLHMTCTTPRQMFVFSNSSSTYKKSTLVTWGVCFIYYTLSTRGGNCNPFTYELVDSGYVLSLTSQTGEIKSIS